MIKVNEWPLVIKSNLKVIQHWVSFKIYATVREANIPNQSVRKFNITHMINKKNVFYNI